MRQPQTNPRINKDGFGPLEDPVDKVEEVLEGGSAGLPIVEEPRTDLEDELCLREEEVKQEEDRRKVFAGFDRRGGACFH